MNARKFHWMVYLCLAGLILSLCTVPPGIKAADEFDGSGTGADPYRISNSADMQRLGELLAGGGYDAFANKHYVMTADIDLSGIADWIPIGLMGRDFQGSFDGQGHRIKGLKIRARSPVSETYGLFGTNSGTIRNLVLSEVSLDATIPLLPEDYENEYGVINMGALCGANFGTVEDVRAAGSVSLKISQNSPLAHGCVGGITGFNDGVMARVYNSCSVIFDEADTAVEDVMAPAGGIAGYGGPGSRIYTASNSAAVSNLASGSRYNTAGGICGSAEGTIGGSANSGKITANSDMGSAGGICGDAYELGVAACYNRGTISAHNAGGFIGVLDGQYGFTREAVIQDSYEAGSVSGANAGVFVGLLSLSTIQVSESFYLESDLPPHGPRTNDEGHVIMEAAELSAAAMADQASYEGAFDFTKDWLMPPYGLNAGYPMLVPMLHMRLESGPLKTEYFIDQALNLKGARLRWSNADMQHLLRDVLPGMVGPFDNQTPGLKTIEVQDLGFTAFFDVTVKEPPGAVELPATGRPGADASGILILAAAAAVLGVRSRLKRSAGKRSGT